MIFRVENVLGERSTARVTGGPEGHWAKLAFERYFPASRRRGIVAL